MRAGGCRGNHVYIMRTTHAGEALPWLASFEPGRILQAVGLNDSFLTHCRLVLCPAMAPPRVHHAACRAADAEPLLRSVAEARCAGAGSGAGTDPAESQSAMEAVALLATCLEHTVGAAWSPATGSHRPQGTSCIHACQHTVLLADLLWC